MVKKMTDSIKSKKRVADFGEVFTSEREVKAMCDLVKDETYRIDSTVLEPACGDGNFLAEILTRKLDTVEKRYGKSPLDFEKYSVLAVSSLYGVDIQEDNAEECRERLFDIWDDIHSRRTGKEAMKGVEDAVRYILRCNILCGDALSLKKSDGEPITFAEWALLNGSYMKRRDFYLSTMLEVQELGGQGDLFLSGDEYDEEIGAYVPQPIKDDYKPIEYWRVQEWESQ